ncbi:hypothetical protein [Geodermatophilus sp. URMC 60]
MVRLRALDQQVVVLTGASCGIGLSTARRAAQRGARCAVVGTGVGALGCWRPGRPAADLGAGSATWFTG